MRSRLIIGQPLSRLPAALAKEIPRGAKVAVIADAAVANRWGAPLRAALARRGFDAHRLVVPSGESSKSLAQAGRLHRELARRRFERKSWLVALGGGVVGDLTGFVAATYLRGVPFVQAPTTLLAQVDASIGGKTGVDIPEGKNLVGAFYHPRLIWIDPEVLSTLPARHWRNGLAEVIKYGAIRDARLFARLEARMEDLVQGRPAAWTPIIARCAAIKADVVERDPVETRGVRAMLNFGHTVGHAIEAAAGYRGVLHGEAVSIGMAVAGALSERLCGLPGIDRVRLNSLLARAGLPTRLLRPLRRSALLEYLQRDKKSDRGTVKFVLLKKLGAAQGGWTVPEVALSEALAAAGVRS